MSSLNLNADSGILQVTWPLLTNQKPEFSFLFVCLYNINMILMFVLYKQTNKKENSGFWLVKSGHVTCRMPLSAFKF